MNPSHLNSILHDIHLRLRRLDRIHYLPNASECICQRPVLQAVPVLSNGSDMASRGLEGNFISFDWQVPYGLIAYDSNQGVKGVEYEVD